MQDAAVKNNPRARMINASLDFRWSASTTQSLSLSAIPHCITHSDADTLRPSTRIPSAVVSQHRCHSYHRALSSYALRHASNTVRQVSTACAPLPHASTPSPIAITQFSSLRVSASPDVT